MLRTANYYHIWKSRLKDRTFTQGIQRLSGTSADDVTTSCGKLETPLVSHYNWVHLQLAINKDSIEHYIDAYLNDESIYFWMVSVLYLVKQQMSWTLTQ